MGVAPAVIAEVAAEGVGQDGALVVKEESVGTSAACSEEAK